MISLTFGLAGTAPEGGGSYMRLIFSPFDVMPDWSGFIPPEGRTGGHSHGNIGRYEEEDTPNHIKVFKFICDTQGVIVEKTYRVKYPLPTLDIINIEMREVKVKIDGN